MRGPAFLLALVALVGAAGLSAGQDNGAEPGATEEVPGADRAPVSDRPPASDQPLAEEGQSGAPAPVNPNPLSGLTLDSLAATRSAPLFTPSRTAPVVDVPVEETTAAAPVEEPPTAEEPPQLELIGIVLTDNSQTALLRDPSTNVVHRLASGDQFDNWELKIVDPRSVEFHQGDRVQDLKMFDVFPVSAVSSEPSGEGMPPDFNGQMRPEADPTDDPNETPSDSEVPAQRSPQSSDIVQGAEDVQNSDVVRAPNATDNPNGAADPDGSANPDAEQVPSGDSDGLPANAPPPDFAPPVGNAPIPDEGAPPPDAN